MNLRKADKPAAISAMALERLDSSASRDGCRRTWSNAKVSTCRSSPTTRAGGPAIAERAVRGMQFVGGLVRSRNELSAPIKYEGGSRPPPPHPFQQIAKPSSLDYHHET